MKHPRPVHLGPLRVPPDSPREFRRVEAAPRPDAIWIAKSCCARPWCGSPSCSSSWWATRCFSDETRGYTPQPTSVALAQLADGNVTKAIIDDKEQRVRLT